MWRKTLLTAAVLLGAQSAYAQAPVYPPPGNFGGALPARGPAVAGTPVVPPPAPITAAPSGPSPGVPGPAVAPAVGVGFETTTAFDPDQAELRWQDSRYQLWSGNTMLKDFGRYEAEGREVLRIVRQLRLNTLTTVGSPRPIMEYWLTNGEAPRGLIAGLRTLPIDTATLTAEQVQGQWCVHDSTRILFNFGQQGDACRQALASIQHYGFSQVGYVGQVAPVMLVFLANTPAMPVNPLMAAPGNPAAPPPANPSHFPHLFGNGQTQQTAAQQTQPAQPNAMPTVPAQPLNQQQPAGMPLQKPGGVAQASLRIPGTEALDRVAIDPRQVQVRHDGQDWKLAMGNHVIASFGPNQADAQLAQAALRYYGCTEQVFVGNPHPVMSYFLAHGQAPHGVGYMPNAVTFRPESMSVRQLGTSYVLYDGTQVIMGFGDRVAEAQQALQAIQQYKFDRMATIGRGDQSMTLFAKTN
jgi:hypothetical protein